MIEAEVKVVGSGMENNMPIVILEAKDEEQKGSLPMRIGSMEALSIVLALEDKEVPRPLTHDLFTRVLGEWDIELKKIEIIKMENNVFFAELVTGKKGEEKRIDARPSDSVALALRKGAPIYIAEQVVEENFVYIDSSEFVNEYRLEDFNI